MSLQEINEYVKVKLVSLPAVQKLTITNFRKWNAVKFCQKVEVT
jgi:hypothetical protein